MSAGLELERPFDPVDRETWRELVDRDRAGASFDGLRTRLPGGLVVEPLYDESDLPVAPPGRPGAPPYVRGARAEASFRLLHSVAASDAVAMAEAAARGRGLSADAAHLDAGACAALDEATVGALAPAVLEPGADALAWIAAAAATVGLEVRFDPLAALARDGALPYGADAAFRWLAELAPGGRPVLVDATVHHDAGAPAPDELGFALATGVAYLRALGDAGHPLADAPRRFVFAFACDTDVFLTVAKLRAARLCWSKVLRATGIDGEGHGMWISARESARARTRLEPLVGSLRSTAAAFGAMVGGAEEVLLRPYRAAPEGERLAITTQHVLRAESHLERVTDPAGGSYHVEALTETLARAAWSVLGEVEAAGGALAMLTGGATAARHAASAAAHLERVRSRRLGRVGVNRYAAAEDPDAVSEGPVVTPAIAEERAEKPVRDAFRGAALGELGAAIRKARPSVAVLRNELRRVGEPLTAPPLVPLREAAPFESLRDRAAALDASRRDVLVIGVGDLRTVKPRMDFAREALLVGGLRVEVLDPSAEAPALTSAPPTVVVCATVPLAPLVERARAAGATQVLVAGPDEDGSGVDGRLHRDMDAAGVLGEVLDRLEAAR